MVEVRQGDCLEVLPTLPEASVDAVVTDPPYGLEFMGKEWDRLAGDWNKGEPATAGHPTGGLERWTIKRPRYHAGASAQQWHQQWAAAALRVLKPGGSLLAFGGSRTYHRLTCAVEDAGFEVRDCLMWVFATGFPKGRGCLKPCYEPILLARKPGPRVLPLNIEECRVPMPGSAPGRWPGNLCHDGSPEVLEAFAAFGEKTSGSGKRRPRAAPRGRGTYRFALDGSFDGASDYERDGDTGTAARFYYCAKAPPSERMSAEDGTRHPTQKPLALMRWLVKLVCPPGGLVLDPFLGSGTTALACEETGRQCIGVESDPTYYAIAQRRLAAARGEMFADASAAAAAAVS